MSELIINTDSNVIEEADRKQKEQSQQGYTPKFKFDEKNYLTTRLNNGETEKEITVRILPISSTDGNIFLSLKIHSLRVSPEVSKSTFKKYICLNDSHIDRHDDRGCPLCNKSKELFAMANACSNEGEKKDLIKSAFSFQSKVAYVVRVIERGKENEGVKFWRFNARTDGQGVYDKLMNINNKRKTEAEQAGINNYSIFDLINGRDITVKLKYVPTTQKTTMDIIDSGFQTPLSNNIDLANKWIGDAKTWRDIYAFKNYDYLDIVSEGEVPVFDSGLQKYVAKKDNSTYDGKENTETRKDEATKTNIKEETKPTRVEELPY